MKSTPQLERIKTRLQPHGAFCLVRIENPQHSGLIGIDPDPNAIPPITVERIGPDCTVAKVGDEVMVSAQNLIELDGNDLEKWALIHEKSIMGSFDPLVN